MEQLSHYMIFMIKTLHKFCLLLLLVTLGCASTPDEPEPVVKKDLFEDMHPEERHIWLPPTQEELDERRRRQKWLDIVGADIERLFMGYADLFADEIILENLLRGTESELQEMEVRLNAEAAGEEKARQVQQALDEMEGTVKEMDAELDAVRREQAARAEAQNKKLAQKEKAQGLRIDEYRQAILLFRNGQYQKSIEKFESLLGKQYPARLKDNILFGLASNYFRLKQYDRSLVYLTDIIDHHPKGDKWLVSHAVAGMVFIHQGKRTQAVQILEIALQHNPNPKLRQMIQRLLEGAKKGAPDVSS